MLVQDKKPAENPHYMKDAFALAGRFYKSVKHSNTYLDSTFTTFEPLFSGVLGYVTKYSEPSFTTVDSKVSLIIDNCSDTLGELKLSFIARKDLYKAAMETWATGKYADASEFAEAVQEKHKHVWTDLIEAHIKQLYRLSLSYKKPGEMLRLAADVLSEGSDSVRNSLMKAWKATQNFQFRSFYAELKALVGEKWNDSMFEKAKIFVSISKLREKLAGRGLDLKKKAQQSAEFGTLLVLAGADEVYFWGRATFDARFPKVIHTLTVYMPFKTSLKSVYDKVADINSDDILRLTWPEDVRNMLRPAIKKVGMDEWTNKYWMKLDKDEDGEVTVGDVAEVIVLIPSQTLTLVKGIFNKLKMIKNGE
jgi:hypothetical protein